MVGGASARRKKSPWLGCLGVLAGAATLMAAGDAQAAQPGNGSESAELRQVVETALPRPDFAPSRAMGLRLDRDAQWSMLALTDPWELRDDEGPLARGPLPGLGRLDIRQNAWQSQPYAATTVASALAAIATRGIPLMRETRDYETIRTHRLGCYFKGRGGGLIWRVEFR